jgi:hypothetical protein
MTAFLQNAQSIFEVARQSDEPEDITIHLNNSTYRIQRSQGRVSVEGRSGAQVCVLQTAARLHRITMPDQPLYLLAS